jgi:hypothetical protein
MLRCMHIPTVAHVEHFIVNKVVNVVYDSLFPYVKQASPAIRSS